MSLHPVFVGGIGHEELSRLEDFRALGNMPNFGNQSRGAGGSGRGSKACTAGGRFGIGSGENMLSTISMDEK